MSILRNLETKIADLVEGAFGRAFRSEVRPVEIARKLAREMEEHRTVSVSRVYVPNEYAVYLSPEDRERFEDYEDALVKELSGYLLEHARQEKLALLSRPNIEFHTDDRLALGEFGIQARLVQPADDPSEEPRQGDRGHTMVYTAERLRRPLEEESVPPPQQATALLLVDGKRIVVGRGGAVIGRSRDCDVVLADPNVSRRHAEVRPVGAGWELMDLGSTNGVVVDGRRVEGRVALHGGERVELGTSVVGFELE
jgi:hypothetical protein